MTPARRRRAWPAVHGVAHKCTRKRVIGQRLCSPGQYQGRGYSRMCINGLKKPPEFRPWMVTDRKPAAVRRLSRIRRRTLACGCLINSRYIYIRRIYVPTDFLLRNEWRAEYFGVAQIAVSPTLRPTDSTLVGHTVS